MTGRDDGFEQRIEFYPAFDKRDSNPAKNYGIHGVDLAFYLIGPDGAVQWKCSTGWQLSHVQRETNDRVQRDIERGTARFPFMFHEPMATDLGYHSRVAHYDGQEPMADDCPLIGGRCFYDGSTLNAEPLLDTLRAEGSEGVWRELRAYYDRIFSKAEAA